MLTDVLTTFGYPEMLVAEYEHWLVLAVRRPATLGAMLIVERSGVTTLGAVPTASWSEFPIVLRTIEEALGKLFVYDRMNLLFLMMATPEVHAAVLPRYAAPREFAGMTFTDSGWPRKPNLDVVHELNAEVNTALVRVLREAFVHVPTPVSV